MAEDRERLFEKALLRHLRADAPGESLCLDPEALAAYYERLLSPQEAAAVKSHLDSCARCQEILAQLESSEGRSELGEDKEMVALGAAVAPTPEKVKPIARRKPFSLGLVLPVGAVAAGLLLWIGISVFRTRPGSMAPSAQVAVNRSEPEAPKPDFEPQKQLDQLSPSPAEGKRKDAPLYDLSEAPKPDSLREYSRRAAVPPAGRDKAEAQLQARASDLKGPPPRPATGRAAEEVEAASEADTLDAAQTTAQSAKSDVARPAGEPWRRCRRLPLDPTLLRQLNPLRHRLQRKAQQTIISPARLCSTRWLLYPDSTFRSPRPADRRSGASGSAARSFTPKTAAAPGWRNRLVCRRRLPAVLRPPTKFAG